jgi:S-DNA-T family DNA segregation ATPase FtsK/SpoIIIE
MRKAGGAWSWLARVPLIMVLVFGAFVTASLIGYDPADPPTTTRWPANEHVRNWCGPAGAWIAHHSFRMMGAGVWVLVLGIGLGVLSWAMGSAVRHPIVRGIGLFMAAIAVSGFQHLLFPQSGAFPDMAGGRVGTFVVAELSARFGPVGTGLWLIGLLGVGALAAMDDWLLWAVGWIWRRGVPVAVAAGAAAGKAAAPVVQRVGQVAGSAAAGTAKASGGALSRLLSSFRPARPVAAAVSASEPASVVEHAVETLREEVEPKEDEPRLVLDEDEEEEEEAVPIRAPRPKRESGRAAGDGSSAEDDEDLPGAPQVFDADQLREKIAKLPIVFGQRNMQVATDADLAALQRASGIDDSTYQFPPLDLLEDPEANFSEKLEQFVREQATALEAALRQYRIDGEVVGIEAGPVVTLYDVRLAPGTKVAAITAVESDIARALRAVNIRVVPNQAGRDTVGIEVPNAHKEKVRLKELMSNPERFARMKLPAFLGKDAAGEPLIVDLTRMPHMLIAGTTGSGKSVCINTIITGFLYTKKPTELRLVLVDPKMVELSQFKDIPHLMCPVVTEMGKAAAILEWACGKMDERYELLAEAGCRDIAAYNDLSWEELKDRLRPSTPEEESRIPRKLPYMVFIIDELADLMMTNKEVEGSIIRIAQKARAVGIHLILATQRPQANVVTGLIKGNMPCRVCFKVNSGIDSRIVMDQKGGELLLGQGDMLFLSPSSHKLRRAQGTLVDDGEIRRVVRFIREKHAAGPAFDRTLLTLRKPGEDAAPMPDSANNSGAALAAAQEDPLFERAVELVLETRRGSVSLLQRRLAIGYTRASRLVDLMGIAGILGEHKGSVARDVIITPEDWEAMKQLAAEEARAKGIEYPRQIRSAEEAQQAELFNAPATCGADGGEKDGDERAA